MNCLILQPFEEKLKTIYEKTYGDLSYHHLDGEGTILLAMFYFFYFSGDIDFFVAPIPILVEKWTGFVNALSAKEKFTLLIGNRKHLSQLARKVAEYNA